MGGYLLRRLLALVPTLLGITLLAFLILNLLPSDPVAIWSSGGAPLSAEAMARLRDTLGAGRGPMTRYGDWLLALLRCDLGRSLRDDRPVGEVVGEALPWTLLLNLCSMAAVYGLAVPLGLLGVRRPGRWEERTSRALLLLLFVTPPFAAALLLQGLFSVRWTVLPLRGTGGDAGGAFLRGLDIARHLVLPTLCLSFSGWAFASRYARAAFRTVLAPEPIDAARSRGLAGSRLARHFAPNALLPLLPLVGAIVPGLVSGSVVVEEIFAWPGVGRLLLRAVDGRDYPVVLSLTLLSGVTVAVGQLVSDLLAPLLDPRVRDATFREETRGA